jgi:phage gp45-like
MNISIKKGSVSKNTSDNTDRPIQSVEYLGRDGDVEVFFPYGFHANAPKGAMAILFSMLGQSSNKVSLVGSPQERIKVESGEVVVYHPTTKAKTYFKNDGSIVTNTDEAILSILKDGTVVVENGSGSITLNPDGTATVDSSLVTMTGDLQVDGSINADGAITSLTSVTAPTVTGSTSVSSPSIAASSSLTVSGLSMGTHKHKYQDTGAAINPATSEGPE